MTSAQQVQALIETMQALGATAELGPPSTARDIAAAEARLGFALPDEYKEFLLEIGRIDIELVRTWSFYGLPEDETVKQLYAETFGELDWDDTDDRDDAQYYPRRFVVLADEGEYCNAAEGYVYDGDLGHIRFTAGADYIERSEYLEVGYWGFLLDELEAIADRLADPKDPLVSGSEDMVRARRKLPA